MGTTRDFDGGFDAKYSLTPSLTLDATYRTDFAQVEVDQQQVNLTRFNLFFPEKRDFFLENSGIFTFGSATPGTSGRNQARRLLTAWREDDWNVSAEYNAVEPNVNPEVGFVRRGDMSQYSGDLSWRPQLRRSDAIRNLNFGTSVDYYNDGDGRIETRTQEATVGIQFENNGSVNFNVNETFDRLVAPFTIRPAASSSSGPSSSR